MPMASRIAPPVPPPTSTAPTVAPPAVGKYQIQDGPPPADARANIDRDLVSAVRALKPGLWLEVPPDTKKRTVTVAIRQALGKERAAEVTVYKSRGGTFVVKRETA